MTAYGERLINVLIDQISESDPDRTYISIAKSASPADGFQDITFRRFACAVNSCAHWIRTSIGLSSEFERIFT